MANDAESWRRAGARKCVSALRPVLLCDLLVVVLLAFWAGSRLDLIVNHGLVGGGGDESHRLVFSYRLCHDFSGHIYSYFFNCTWPALPYVLQTAVFRILQGLGLSADYGTVAISSSTCAYVFAVALAYAALSLRFQRVAGLVAAALLLSLHEATTLAVTSMAESYCMFFLAWAFLFAALPQASRRNAALAGLSLMLATQCRSETIVLSVVFGLYCLHQRGWLAGAACVSISIFPFVLKALVNRATGYSGMSYFNLANYARFENGWHANASKALEALRQYGEPELAFGSLAGFAILAALCGAVAYRTVKTRFAGSEPGFRLAYFALLVGAAGTLSVSILLAMTCSVVLPFPRYFVTCHFLWVLPFAVAVSAPLFRLSSLYGDRAAYWHGLRQSRLRWLRLAVSLACIVVTAGSLYRGTECFRTTAVSLYKEQGGRIPSPILSAKEWMQKNGKQEHVCFDSLIWWETFLFFHNMRFDAKSTQFMVYDYPPVDWHQGRQPERNEKFTAAMHRYIESYQPELIVLAGPEYRRALENIKMFYGFDEKASYLRPYLEEREGGELELKDSPYWKQDSSLTVTLCPAFENEAVAIYRASYSFRR
ncbi:MAG TPA: hypothetical protein VMV10_30930 [Pirellulales bacterium]|nr:hypothetical protein [Pirellulales bacterium]